MKINGRLGGKLALVLAFTPLVGIGPPLPAFAATDVVDGVCHSNEICHFEDNSYGGRVADWNACEPNWSCGIANFTEWEYYGTSTNVNDRVNSLKNRLTATGSSTWAMVAQHSFGGGTLVCYPKGAAYVSTGAITNEDSSMWVSYNYC